MIYNMKYLVILIGVAFTFLACNSGKNVAKDSGLTTAQKELEGLKKAMPNLPACVFDKIAEFQKTEKANPPRAVYKYDYKGSTVYYITAPCCDIYPELFDADCNLLCAPDGGFTGKGDGKCVDFHKLKSNEKLIWKDNRK